MGLTQKIKDNCQAIIAVVAVAGIISGGLAYFAKAADLELVQLRLDQKIVADRLYETRKQVWALEEKNRMYGNSCSNWPDSQDRQRYRELKTQTDELQKQFDAMRKKAQ